jgi:DNA-binding MarR family transcriptional regulator
VLAEPGMHVVLFGLKRAWQSSLRVTRGALGALGLTAARFDLLYALQHLNRFNSTYQSDLRRALGVSRTTVSRMLVSLEVLGLVKRKRTGLDGRQRLVLLTAAGRARIRLAIKRLIRSGAAELAVDNALAGTLWYDEGVCFRETENFEIYLKGIRRAFRDRATLYYPWHPDD